MTLSWAVNTANVTGTFSYEIRAGAVVVASGSAATGSVETTVPDLGGVVQPVSWTFRAIETGGNGVTNNATVSLNGDPGIPTAASQASSGTVHALSPKPIRRAAVRDRAWIAALVAL